MRSVEAHALIHISSLNLGISDFTVLEILYHKGPLPVNAIGKKVLLTSGSITVAVDRLEKKGLVTRKSVADDRRIRAVELTLKGLKLIKVTFKKHKNVMEQAVSALSKEEQLKLAGLLKKLGKGASRLV